MTPEFNKEHYKHLKEMAKAYKVSTITYITPAAGYEGVGYNGFTVAYSPATELDDNRMVEVAVSYCAPEDDFKKKVGKYHALRKFFEENNFIHLPLGQMYKDNTEDLEYFLEDMFSI